MDSGKVPYRIIDEFQFQINTGNAFLTSYNQSLDASGATANLYIRIKTSGKLFFFNVCVFNIVRVELKLYEDTVWTSGGTQLTPTNLFMASAKTPTHQVYFNAAPDTDGTQIIPSAAASTGLFVEIGQTVLFDTPIITKRNTEYQLNLINRSATVGDAGVIISGFEK